MTPDQPAAKSNREAYLAREDRVMDEPLDLENLERLLAEAKKKKQQPSSSPQE